jgi:hypothetical protein
MAARISSGPSFRAGSETRRFNPGSQFTTTLIPGASELEGARIAQIAGSVAMGGLTERYGLFGLEAGSCHIDRGGHDGPVGRQVKQFFAVAPPAGLDATGTGSAWRRLSYFGNAACQLTTTISGWDFIFSACWSTRNRRPSAETS